MKINIRKNILFGGIGILIFNSSNIFAFENKVKIGGTMDAQGIYYNTNGDPSQRMLSTHNKTQGLASSGHFYIDYQLIADEGWKYGTKISITQTSKNDRATPFGIYVESDYGRIEVGSDKGAATRMIIHGYSNACAGGTSWDSSVISSPDKSKVQYVTNFSNFLDAKTRNGLKSDYARKITYYTPKFGFNAHKFQLGLSYAPDSSNAGHTEIHDPTALNSIVSTYPHKFAIKDGISYGIAYNGTFSDELSLKIAVTGEKGKPVAYDKEGKSRVDEKFKDLNSYNIGAEVTYNDLSFAGSYKNYNKSFNNAAFDKFGSNADIYAGGVSYKFLDKYTASLNHFYSNYKKNKVNATSVGFDYLIVKGIKASIQYTSFQMKGKHMDNNNIVVHDASKGNMLIIGGKISL